MEGYCTIYADGGCSGNPGPGAWAFIVIIDEIEYYLSGGEVYTTNNRMELIAVIRALEHILTNTTWKAQKIVVHTDSQYVKNGIQSWLRNWVRNGWKTKNKTPVKNQDLWKRLNRRASKLVVDWNWVKGHSGDVLNERCDTMVKKKIIEIQKFQQDF